MSGLVEYEIRADGRFSFDGEYPEDATEQEICERIEESINEALTGGGVTLYNVEMEEAGDA